ncbi:Glutathione synthase [Gracilaria domingensis]|nr:Glutathione synthase [Gracilaria domingensis]
MPDSMFRRVPKPTPPAVLEAVSYAASHGILMSSAKHATPGTSLVHAPFTYYPSPFHAESYRHAVEITPYLNSLVHRIASDHKYLKDKLAATIESDEFTRRLFALLACSEDQPQQRRVKFSICRYDYFMHVGEHGEYRLRMVEMNCIAASYGCLGTKISHLHRYLSSHPVSNAHTSLKLLPKTDALHALPAALATAHKAFLDVCAPDSSVPVVLVMVVQPGDTNSYDQDLLRQTLWEKHSLEMVRLSLADIYQCASLDASSNLTLTLSDRSQPLIASIVYFRAGYTPNDFVSEKEWTAREIVEKSSAAKCPSIAMQLVGTKKIQQVLDQPGEVERFLPEEQAKKIRATFARQFALDEDEEEAHRMTQTAMENEMDFVLKPQREGGGNNVYAQQMKDALRTMSAKERAAFVLMERIRPPAFKNVMIRDGMAVEDELVAELGVYGVHLSVGDEVIDNSTGGTLLRSKPASKEDGGVSAGIALLDSPLLFEQ